MGILGALIKNVVDKLETQAGITNEQAERYAVWRAYKCVGSDLKGKGDGFDRNGNVIDRIFASDANYVIYFSDTELHYEATDGLLKTTGKLDSKLAHINRLLPQENDKDTKERRKQELELVADAFEMWFCGHHDEALETLDDILEILRGNRENSLRLFYQFGAFLCSAAVWILFLRYYDRMAVAWRPWIQAIALAAAGGVLSVCINLSKAKVNVNHKRVFLISAGCTRAIIAMLCGAACLLAIRAKVILGMAVDGKNMDVLTPLLLTEMFFCFVSGFSETFIPNILAKSETETSGGGQGSDKPASKPASSDPAGGAGVLLPDRASSSSGSSSSTSSGAREAGGSSSASARAGRSSASSKSSSSSSAESEGFESPGSSSSAEAESSDSAESSSSSGESESSGSSSSSSSSP